jgi:undecaprenyl-diphosphatase
MSYDLFKAFVLGIVEGLTEFLPVSSTGHLLLLEHFFGFDDDAFGKTFVVLIQLGAILAILSVYFLRLWNIALGMFTNARDRRFVIGVLIAFLPAAVIGAAAHGIIKGVLFNPWIVCFTLILGGAVLLWVDQLELRPRYKDATTFSLPIVSAMLLGADKRSAAEFSFFLAIPTMGGAFAYDLYKNWAQMTGSNTLLVVVGFVTSFVCAWIVVRTFLDYVARRGFALFAWWRVIVGSLGLIGLALGK